MTTLVWDGKNRILASDSREVWYDHLIAKSTKIYELPRKGCWVAVAGSSEMAMIVVNSLYKMINNHDSLFHCNTDTEYKGFCGILIYDYTPYVLLKRLVPMPIYTPFYTLGTGGSYALAALHMGKNGIEAVKFASQFDCHTDEEIQHVNVPNPKTKRTRS
jgi:hypothetical protein